MKPPVTLTLEQLAQLLGAKTNTTPEQCASFIKEYFDTISQGITDDGTATVRNFGTFTALPNNVSFSADNAFSQIINAPFAALPAIPLLDDEEIDIRDNDDNDSSDTSNDSEYNPEVVPEQPTVVTEEQTEEAHAEQTEQTTVVQETTVIIPQKSIENKPATVIPDTVSDEPDSSEEETPVDEPTEPIYHEITSTHTSLDDIPAPSFAEKRIHARKRPSRCSFYVWTSVLFVVGLILGTCLGYLWYHKINAFFSAPMGSVDSEEKVIVVEQIKTVAPQPTDTITTTTQVPDTATLAVATDTIIQQAKPIEQAKPEPRKPRYDTVDKRTYLATLARRYYGCGDYWVYIYQANKDKKNLKHPDRIAPGTQLMIPYKDELPLTGNDSADLLAARRIGSAIYARFK